MSPNAMRNVWGNGDKTHKLAVDIATHCDRAAHRLDIGLLHENLTCLARGE